MQVIQYTYMLQLNVRPIAIKCYTHSLILHYFCNIPVISIYWIWGMEITSNLLVKSFIASLTDPLPLQKKKEYAPAHLDIAVVVASVTTVARVH